MGFLKVARLIIRGIGLLDSVLLEYEQEKAQKQVKKEAEGKKISEIYQKASNGPFHK